MKSKWKLPVILGCIISLSEKYNILKLIDR